MILNCSFHLSHVKDSDDTAFQFIGILVEAVELLHNLGEAASACALFII